MPGLRIAGEGLANLAPPLALDVRQLPWRVPSVDAIFSANTLHIMHWDAVQAFFMGLGSTLAASGSLCVYGPFMYEGRHTSASNAAFDQYLKGRDSGSGIREFEAVDALARAQGLTLVGDHAMPANNRTLHWRRVADRGNNV